MLQRSEDSAYCDARWSPWTFKAALEETEEALKTAYFVRIGEFPPGSMARSGQIPGAEGALSFEHRVEERAALCELGVKYDVPVLCHDQFIRMREGEWKLIDLLAKVSEMNPEAKIVQTHGAVEGERERGMDAIKEAYTVIGSLDNVYMETGGGGVRNSLRLPLRRVLPRISLCGGTTTVTFLNI